ncbi:DUF1643 domain-containing protein [Paraburkholderia sabiae]|uniref:DUF1643 domain-containing protein n=1 Tax=Paraburkholderia sabiae TaxID=273251 RepID=A0ABU9QMQ4_9BURK|nr:DUF1643 domain-containing protein [Paraburkholderia sabiae]CAD6561280.1 hypothetical protein LMG24235_07246 [Paraburkholderia sabiae]
MSAVISPCGTYRYLLTRAAESLSPMKSTALFAMLNPSTADATLDDPTIRRCREFAKLWDCDGLAVANLYALRTADTANLLAVSVLAEGTMLILRPGETMAVRNRPAEG